MHDLTDRYQLLCFIILHFRPRHTNIVGSELGSRDLGLLLKLLEYYTNTESVTEFKTLGMMEGSVINCKIANAEVGIDSVIEFEPYFQMSCRSNWLKYLLSNSLTTNHGYCQHDRSVLWMIETLRTSAF